MKRVSWIKFQASSFMFQEFIDRLRSRPLYQRHLMVWLGSLIIFLAISWVWIGQVKIQLASLNPQGVPITETQEIEEPPSLFGRVGDAFDTFQDGIASLVSLFRQGEEQEPSHIEEGSELDQFLEFEPFPGE